MKIKMVMAIALAAIFLFASTAGVTTGQYSSNDDQLPELKVELKIWDISLYWQVLVVTVENLEDEWVNLGVGSPSGGFVIYNESGKEIYREPRYTIMILKSLSLWPHQKKIIYLGLWNMKRHPAGKYIIHGFIHGYEYKGETYPSIHSEPEIIYPPAWPM